jgi:hypothetical protein
MSHYFESSTGSRMIWRRPVSLSNELKKVKKQRRKELKKPLMLWPRVKKRGEISLISMRKLIRKGPKSMKSTSN